MQAGGAGLEVCNPEQLCERCSLCLILYNCLTLAQMKALWAFWIPFSCVPGLDAA